MFYTIPDCLAIPYSINTCSCILRQSSTDTFFFYKFLLLRNNKFLSLTRGEANSCGVWAKKFTKRCDPRAEFALFFAQPKPALFVVACLFICFFFYFPVVAAFSFLKIPTRVFPMKYLETTYIFFMHIGSSSNSFSLQIE